MGRRLYDEARDRMDGDMAWNRRGYEEARGNIGEKAMITKQQLKNLRDICEEKDARQIDEDFLDSVVELIEAFEALQRAFECKTSNVALRLYEVPGAFMEGIKELQEGKVVPLEVAHAKEPKA